MMIVNMVTEAEDHAEELHTVATASVKHKINIMVYYLSDMTQEENTVANQSSEVAG